MHPLPTNCGTHAPLDKIYFFIVLRPLEYISDLSFYYFDQSFHFYSSTNADYFDPHLVLKRILVRTALPYVAMTTNFRFEGGFLPTWFLVHQTKPEGRYTTFTWCEVLIMLYVLGTPAL